MAGNRGVVGRETAESAYPTHGDGASALPTVTVVDSAREMATPMTANVAASTSFGGWMRALKMCGWWGEGGANSTKHEHRYRQANKFRSNVIGSQ